MANAFTYLTDKDIKRLEDELNYTPLRLGDVLSVVNDIIEQHAECHYDIGYNDGYTDCCDAWL